MTRKWWNEEASDLLAGAALALVLGFFCYVCLSLPG